MQEISLCLFIFEAYLVCVKNSNGLQNSGSPIRQTSGNLIVTIFR